MKFREWLLEESVMPFEKHKGFDEGVSFDDISLNPNISSWIPDAWDKIKEFKQRGMMSAADEWDKTVEIKPIIEKLINNKKINKDEWESLKERALDLGKTSLWGAIAVPPGTIPQLILFLMGLEAVGAKPMPKSWYRIASRLENLDNKAKLLDDKKSWSRPDILEKIKKWGEVNKERRKKEKEKLDLRNKDDFSKFSPGSLGAV